MTANSEKPEGKKTRETNKQVCGDEKDVGEDEDGPPRRKRASEYDPSLH